MPPILYAVYPHLAPAAPPSSSPLVDAYRLARRAIAAKPGDERGDREHGGSDEAEAAQALEACKLFAFFAIYNIADGGLNSLMTSLAGSMTTHVSCDFAAVSSRRRASPTTYLRRRRC